MKKKYECPKVEIISIADLGDAYFGAMASSCTNGGKRC